MLGSHLAFAGLHRRSLRPPVIVFSAVGNIHSSLTCWSPVDAHLVRWQVHDVACLVQILIVIIVAGVFQLSVAAAVLRESFTLGRLLNNSVDITSLIAGCFLDLRVV